MKITFFATLLILLLSSCLSRVDKRGYMFDNSGSDLLKEGVTNREGVLRLMGFPTIISSFDSDEAWVYYAEDVKYTLFFRPDIVARNILVIRFDSDNSIKKLQKLNLKDGNSSLNFVSKYTPVQSHKEDGFFKSIMGNVGKIKPQ